MSRDPRIKNPGVDRVWSQWKISAKYRSGEHNNACIVLLQHRDIKYAHTRKFFKRKDYSPKIFAEGQNSIRQKFLAQIKKKFTNF